VGACRQGRFQNPGRQALTLCCGACRQGRFQNPGRQALTLCCGACRQGGPPSAHTGRLPVCAADIHAHADEAEGRAVAVRVHCQRATGVWPTKPQRVYHMHCTWGSLRFYTALKQCFKQTESPWYYHKHNAGDGAQDAVASLSPVGPHSPTFHTTLCVLSQVDSYVHYGGRVLLAGGERLQDISQHSTACQLSNSTPALAHCAHHATAGQHMHTSKQTSLQGGELFMFMYIS
jgi:hypothetical protein